MKQVIFFLFLSFTLLTGCGDYSHQEPFGSDIEHNQLDKERTLNIYKTIEYDFDSPEGQLGIRKILLFTDASQDVAGNFEWEDGQQFMLKALLDSSEEIEIMPLTYIQFPSIEFDSFIKLNENQFCITVCLGTGASYTLKEYAYDTKNKCFIETILYQEDNINNLKHSNIIIN